MVIFVFIGCDTIKKPITRFAGRKLMHLKQNSQSAIMDALIIPDTLAAYTDFIQAMLQLRRSVDGYPSLMVEQVNEVDKLICHLRKQHESVLTVKDPASASPALNQAIKFNNK